jgi:hypothetical protein
MGRPKLTEEQLADRKRRNNIAQKDRYANNAAYRESHKAHCARYRARLQLADREKKASLETEMRP